MHIPLYQKKKKRLQPAHKSEPPLNNTSTPLAQLRNSYEIKNVSTQRFYSQTNTLLQFTTTTKLIPKIFGIGHGSSTNVFVAVTKFYTIHQTTTTLLFWGLRPALNKIYDTKNTYGSTAKIKSKALVQCLCYKLCHHTKHQNKHINTL